MPSPEHVAWAKLRVATMIGCAIGILGVLVYLLLGGSDFLQPAAPVHAYITDLSGLTKGSDVRFNGIRVGQVTSFELAHLNDPHKVVRLEMDIIQHYLPAIPEDSTVQVSAATVLGDRYADVNEGQSPRHLQPGGELASPPPKEISTQDLIKAARQITENFNGLFADLEAGRGPLGELVHGDAFYKDALSWVTTAQKQMRAALGKDTPAGRLLYDEHLYSDIAARIGRINTRLSELQAGQGPGGPLLQDSAMYDRVHKSVLDLNRTLADLNAGKGQVGKLLKDDEMYVRLNRTVDDLNTQLDALNAGQGELGKLMVSSSLYENLHGSTMSLQKTLKDLRENPKKYLWLKLF